jgi:uncharacterized protein
VKDKSKKLIIFILFFIALWFIRVLLYGLWENKIEDIYLSIIVSAFFKFSIWVIPTFLYIKFIDHKNPFEFLKFTTSLKKGLLWSFVIIIIGGFYQCIALYFKLDIFKFSLPGLVSTVLLTPVFEETLYRGFLYNKLREITSDWKANLAQSVLFVYIHVPGWIILQHMSAKEMISSIVSIFILSLALGFLIKRTNSIYPSIVLHAVNNWISAF